MEVSHTESHYVLSHVHSHTHKHSATVALRTSTATRTTTTTILTSVATITANHIGMLSSHQSCPIYKYIDTLTHTHIQISSHPKVTGKTVNSVEWNNSHSHTLPHTVGCIRPSEEDLSKINNCDGVSMCGGGHLKTYVTL